jgi:hypothetical protein
MDVEIATHDLLRNLFCDQRYQQFIIYELPVAIKVLAARRICCLERYGAGSIAIITNSAS